MILYKKKVDTAQWLDKQRLAGKSIGFVPTMGALHQGHLSLISASRAENDLTVCSIFVNPTQFNDPSDFEKYPISLDTDIKMLEEAGCDFLFLPGISEMYPGGPPGDEKYALGELETLLEGKFRPGHYQGVCMVVRRLLETVKPDSLYLGQKDYQQCMVLSRLVEIMGYNNTRIVVCPTLREPEGLAMSSRNRRLTEAERNRALTIYRVLRQIKAGLQPGPVNRLEEAAIAELEANGFRTDYVSIADATTLRPVTDWNGSQPIVALVAAFLGEVRLIDNIILTD